MSKSKRSSKNFAESARRQAAVRDGFYDGRFAPRKHADAKSYSRERFKFAQDPRLSEWDEWDHLDF